MFSPSVSIVAKILVKFCVVGPQQNRKTSQNSKKLYFLLLLLSCKQLPLGFAEIGYGLLAKLSKCTSSQKYAMKKFYLDMFASFLWNSQQFCQTLNNISETSNWIKIKFWNVKRQVFAFEVLKIIKKLISLDSAKTLIIVANWKISFSLKYQWVFWKKR